MKNLKKSNQVIKVSGQGVLLEINEQCYTGCNHCYLDHAKPNGGTVNVVTLFERIEKITQYTNANAITIVGGEPLLHPQLKEIIEKIQRMKLKVNIITSGVVPGKNQENIKQYILEQYRTGGISHVDLSYQVGKNETPFEEFVRQLIIAMPEAQKAHHAKRTLGEKIAGKNKKKNFLSTSVTLSPENCRSSAELKRIYEFLDTIGKGQSNDFINYTDEKGTTKQITFDEYIRAAWERLQKHFSPYHASEKFSETSNLNLPNKLIWDIRYWGATTIQGTPGNRNIIRPQGTKKISITCPAMSSQIEENSVTIPSLIVKADGKFEFPEPHCLPERNISQFPSIDTINSKEELLAKIKQGIKTRQSIIFDHKRKNAKGNKTQFCASDHEKQRTSEICYSCPVDSICNTCHNQVGRLKGIPIKKIIFSTEERPLKYPLDLTDTKSHVLRKTHSVK